MTTLSIGLLAIALLVTLFNLLTAPRLGAEAKDADADQRTASLLIPARNEALNLPALLASIPLDGLEEILILDDQSADGTAAIVEAAAAADPRIRLLRGSDCPAGWLGKNWACHQMSGQAKGDVLIFCDADVVLTGGAIEGTLAGLKGLDALSALPRQRFSGWFDAAVVPLIVQTSIVTLLPMQLIPRTTSTSLCAATGQWLAFRRESYRAIGGHEAVQGEVLEDVELARQVKRAGLRFGLFLGGESLSVGMYQSRRETVEGFTKNVYSLVGQSPIGLAIGMVAFYLLALHPFVAAIGGSFLPIALLLIVRAGESWMVRGRLASLVLHPLGAVAVLWLALQSAFRSSGGTTQWKGRTIPQQKIPRH